jgi:hypothetical protein
MKFLSWAIRDRVKLTERAKTIKKNNEKIIPYKAVTSKKNINKYKRKQKRQMYPRKRCNPYSYTVFWLWNS